MTEMSTIFIFKTTMQNFIAIMIVLAGALASISFAADSVSSDLRLCHRQCGGFHWRVVSVCKETCDTETKREAIALCRNDEPDNREDFLACIEAKADLGGAYTPQEALTAVGRFLSYVPAPSYVRRAFAAVGEFAGDGFEAYTKRTERLSRTVARATGQSASDSCSVASFPLFTSGGLVPLTQRGVLSTLNPLAQYVLFSEKATCDGKEVTFPSGDKLKARGVVLVNGPRCGWPIPSSQELPWGSKIAIFMDDSCKPVGHGLVVTGSKRCVHTVAHVKEAATMLVYHDKTGPVLMHTTDVSWVMKDDYAREKGCDALVPVPAGTGCALHTFASGMGMETSIVSVQSLTGAGTFGTVDRPTHSGTSGSPCVAGHHVSLVSAVVYGGVELVPEKASGSLKGEPASKKDDDPPVYEPP